MFLRPPPTLISGSGPPPPPLSEGLDRHCFSVFYRIPIQERRFVQTLDCEIVPGGYSWEFLVGWVPPGSLNLDSISDHTCFQTWPPKSLPVFRPGGGRSQNTTTKNRNYAVIAEIKTATKRFLNLHFEFIYYTFFLFLWK